MKDMIKQVFFSIIHKINIKYVPENQFENSQFVSSSHFHVPVAFQGASPPGFLCDICFNLRLQNAEKNINFFNTSNSKLIISIWVNISVSHPFTHLCTDALGSEITKSSRHSTSLSLAMAL